LTLPELTTARLVIRVPTPGEANAIALFQRRNREHFAPWDPIRDDSFYHSAYWREELEKVVERAACGRSFQFVLVDPDEPARILGQIALTGLTRGAFQAAYLGYGLDRDAVGRGLMREALEAVIEFCFTELNLHRLMANYMPGNDRSARLLAGLGFVEEGLARDYLRLGGEWRDHVLMRHPA